MPEFFVACVENLKSVNSEKWIEVKKQDKKAKDSWICCKTDIKEQEHKAGDKNKYWDKSWGGPVFLYQPKASLSRFVSTDLFMMQH